MVNTTPLGNKIISSRLVRRVGMTLILLCPLLPASTASAQQGESRQTITIYVVYARRQTETELSRGLESRDRARAERHAEGLRRVEGKDGKIYAEVKVRPEERTVTRRQVSPPPEPQKDAPWRGKGKVGGTGEGFEENPEDATFFRPDSEEQLDKGVETINEAVEEGLNVEELEQLASKVDFDDMEYFGEEFDLEKRSIALEGTKKELDAEKKAIEQEEEILEQQKRKLHGVPTDLSGQTAKGYLSIKSNKLVLVFGANGQVSGGSSDDGTGQIAGSYTFDGQSIHMKIGLSEFNGRLSGRTLSGTRFREKDGRRDNWSATLGYNSTAKSDLEYKKRKLSQRRVNYDTRSREYSSQSQRLQQDQQALRDRRKHKSLEPSGGE
ncbi:MAG: hypothetical protein RJP95_00310 [Pirellulales bacterium]